MMKSLLDRILGYFAKMSSPVALWYQWPFPVSLAIVLGHRANMRRANLFDTRVSHAAIVPPENFDLENARTADGSFNDLSHPMMGMAGSRFGRNTPLSSTFGETTTLMKPSPRLVSNRLLARQNFVPVPHLNALAAAWIQFMVHDWLSHGKSDPASMHDVPLPDGDDLQMTSRRRGPKTHGKSARSGPPGGHTDRTRPAMRSLHERLIGPYCAFPKRATTIIVKKTISAHLIFFFLPTASFADETAVIAFKDPPICSSFEKPSQPNENNCTITSNGNDEEGNERKKVSIRLKAQSKIVDIGGHQVKTENYGTYLPPVVEARAGDTVAVTLTNSLDEPLIRSHHSHHCELDEGQTAPQNSNPTNLHYFHGGVVSPNNGNSPGSARSGTGDNIYSCLERGQEHTYEVPIPGVKELNAAILEGKKGTKIAHPPGLNWYHSHLHGISANQVMGGLAGLLSVGRRDENLRAKCDDPGSDECREKTEEVRANTLVKYALLRDISLRKDNGEWVPDPDGQNFGFGRVCGVAREDGVTLDTENTGLRKGFCQPNLIGPDQSAVDPDKLWLFTINGQKYPTIEVDESKTGVLLRVGNLSPNIAYWLELYDEEASDPASGKFITKKMTVLSVDGVVPAKPQSAADAAELISVESYEIPDLLLMPASRVEVYIDRRDIDSTKDTTFVLRTKNLNAGGDRWPEIQLARITFKASEKAPVLLALNAAIAQPVMDISVKSEGPVTERDLPPGCMRDLQDGEYRKVEFKTNEEKGKWKIVTSIMENGSVKKDENGNDLKIDRAFEGYVDSSHKIKWDGGIEELKILHTCVRLNRNDDVKPQLWELSNPTADLHNFHIHQMKFRLATSKEIEAYGITLPAKSSTCDKVIDCKGPDYKFFEAKASGSISNLGTAELTEGGTINSILEWHDTMPMPPSGKVYVMMSFVDDAQVGRFVYHCHILKHEDNGLMAPIEVWDPEARSDEIEK
ncbi:multicopper oxidase domain-containing protein [Sinorhizobium meliloti]|nr:multicopper oxidase domain-containing protein [Sinorhizobium meliloti]MDX0196918.1 multicopper oxidase domain-containing protein [Sinorhizobium meliloti]